MALPPGVWTCFPCGTRVNRVYITRDDADNVTLVECVTCHKNRIEKEEHEHGEENT